MPLMKSRSKKAMSKNIETEMDSGKPQKQAVAIAYSVMKRARKNKKAFGGAVEDPDPRSLQEHMESRPNDKEDRGHVLFDGDAERIDPLKKEYREDEGSIHMGRTDLDEDDQAAEDIVSRIMRKMKRK